MLRALVAALRRCRRSEGAAPSRPGAKASPPCFLAALTVLWLSGVAPAHSQASSAGSAGGPAAASVAADRSAPDARSSRSSAGQLHRLWLLAQAHLREDAPRAALPYLDMLVTAAPGEVRFRLELAYALFLIGSDERARFHFEQALGGEVSERERAVVRSLLDRIGRRKSWDARFHFAVVPETNPFRRTAAETISIGEFDFRLSPEARAQSGTGLVLGGAFAWTPDVSRDVKARFSFSARAETYEESSFNELALRVEAGLIALRDGGRTIGGGASFQQRRLGHDVLYKGPGLYLTYEQPLAPQTRLAFRTEFADLSYPDLPGRDGSRATGFLRISHALSPQLAVHASLFGERIEAVRESESGTLHGVTLGAHRTFEGGLMASLELSRSWSERDGASPLFVRTRQDDLWGVTARLLNRNFTLGGFAPTLEVGYERQHSNVALYEYETWRSSLSLSRQF